jgi:hypothetical protein
MVFPKEKHNKMISQKVHTRHKKKLKGGKQMPSIKEGEIIQWTKEKGQAIMYKTLEIK